MANDSANTALDEVKKEAAKAAQEAHNEDDYVKFLLHVHAVSADGPLNGKT